MFHLHESHYSSSNYKSGSFAHYEFGINLDKYITKHDICTLQHICTFCTFCVLLALHNNNDDTNIIWIIITIIYIFFSLFILHLFCQSVTYRFRNPLTHMHLWHLVYLWWEVTHVFCRYSIGNLSSTSKLWKRNPQKCAAVLVFYVEILEMSAGGFILV